MVLIPLALAIGRSVERILPMVLIPSALAPGRSAGKMLPMRTFKQGSKRSPYYLRSGGYLGSNMN